MLFDVADTDEYVASTFALSCEQVFPDGPVYHFIVYGDVPPDHEDESVMVWPESIVGFVGVGAAGVVSAGFMVKVDEYTEFTVSDTASVTMTLNFSGLFDVSALSVVYVKVLLVDATPVNSMFAVIASVALFDISQL